VLTEAIHSKGFAVAQQALAPARLSSFARQRRRFESDSPALSHHQGPVLGAYEVSGQLVKP
jgi:hypothetical protein